MGVPSYFSHIIRTHANILCKYIDIINKNIEFDRFYMDCNSILYDSFHSIDQKQPYVAIEKQLLEKTSEKIIYYVQQIQPQSTLYIAFDGVAPFAKIEQQKTRRYRSWFETSTLAKFEEKPASEITSSMFTPGTEFMKKLSLHIKQTFSNDKIKEKLKVKNIIVATPDQAGEGEHKLYEHLRRNPIDPAKQIAIYGLDADLIMLSLFHLSYCPNIFIVREAPSFAHVLINEKKEDINPEEPLFLDVATLGRCVASEMNCSYPDNHRMYDYVFLCFLLGNDFLPHFPALNIRTHGIQRLVDIYRNVIGNTQERFLISKSKPYTIQWREVTRLFQELAKQEHVFIKQEYGHRKKWDDKTPENYPTKTVEEKHNLIQNLPVLFRGKEQFINPYESGWEERYYHTLFLDNSKRIESAEDIDRLLPSRKEISMNYLEGLEWVFTYYTNTCMDWRWSYKYHYPPLLKDLVKFVPYGKMTFFDKPGPNARKPLRALTQLAYVLPPPLHPKLLPYHVSEMLQKKYSHCFLQETDENGTPKMVFRWAFCRYFWESHIIFPEISQETIVEWEKDF